MSQPMQQSSRVTVNADAERPIGGLAKDLATAVILAALLATVLISLGAAASTVDSVNNPATNPAAAIEDCVGRCAENTEKNAAKITHTATPAVVAVVVDEVTVTAKRESAMTPESLCNQSKQDHFVAQAESLNDQIKPIKALIGYVRSPQGLAIKLVNDHVVKIPDWVGYAMDPLGSIKNKAMDKVTTRAKSALGWDRKASVSCSASAIAEPDLSSVTEESALNGSTDAPSIPADTNI